jgi:His/Glu/Gln/Arg/opine family amino acid ABC transporter permease subunit
LSNIYIYPLICGILLTLKIAILSTLIGITLGTILGFLLTTNNKAINSLIDGITTLIRGTPMLIQIAFFYYALLPALGIKLTALTAAIIAIGINSSAYLSQVIKSGILSIAKGQTEAGRVLGLSTYQINRFIIFPQAIINMLPAIGNELITLIKDSSLASTIGVMELFAQGKNIISQTYDAITIYTVIALIYLILTTSISIAITIFERKFKYVKN